MAALQEPRLAGDERVPRTLSKTPPPTKSERANGEKLAVLGRTMGSYFRGHSSWVGVDCRLRENITPSLERKMTKGGVVDGSHRWMRFYTAHFTQTERGVRVLLSRAAWGFHVWCPCGPNIVSQTIRFISGGGLRSTLTFYLRSTFVNTLGIVYRTTDWL